MGVFGGSVWGGEVWVLLVGEEGVEETREVVWLFLFFFLMPPAEVYSSGQRPCALKYSTAWRAVSWRASFFDECSVSREPKGSGWPSMVRRQAKWLPER